MTETVTGDNNAQPIYVQINENREVEKFTTEIKKQLLKPFENLFFTTLSKYNFIYEIKERILSKQYTS